MGSHSIDEISSFNTTSNSDPSGEGWNLSCECWYLHVQHPHFFWGMNTIFIPLLEGWIWYLSLWRGMNMVFIPQKNWGCWTWKYQHSQAKYHPSLEGSKSQVVLNEELSALTWESEDQIMLWFMALKIIKHYLKIGCNISQKNGKYELDKIVCF